jgi:hypothetical protein
MWVNGEVGAVCVKDGAVFSILSFVTSGDRISRIYVIRNPDKLAGIAIRDPGTIERQREAQMQTGESLPSEGLSRNANALRLNAKDETNDASEVRMSRLEGSAAHEFAGASGQLAPRHEASPRIQASHVLAADGE